MVPPSHAFGVTRGPILAGRVAWIWFGVKWSRVTDWGLVILCEIFETDVYSIYTSRRKKGRGSLIPSFYYPGGGIRASFAWRAAVVVACGLWLVEGVDILGWMWYARAHALLYRGKSAQDDRQNLLL